MQDYIRKYFWLLGAFVVMICAFFTARACNDFAAGKYLNDDPDAETKITPSRQAKPSKVRSKIGEPLAKRNMFCSDCEPVQPEVENEQVAGDGVPLTSLPLQLVATNVSSKEAYSFATIRNTDSEVQGAYWVDSEIPGAGTVKVIRSKYVDFAKDGGRIERISLLSDAPTVTRPKPTRTRPRPRSNRDELSAELDQGIKKVSDDKYEIDRGLVDKMLENPMSVARGARIVPSVKNGKPNGFKLYAIRPSSVYAKIGLMNGDTIHAINGMELTTPDKALEVYSKVKESSNLTVNITRRGKPVTVDYSIR